MNMELLGPLEAWPVMLLAAWLAGEWASRRLRLPRVCAYGAVGLLLGGLGLSQGLASHAAMGLIANVALALALFELGYRINLRWFRLNPWLLVAGAVQGVLTFAAVFWVAGYFGLGLNHRLVLAAVCVASSPASILRVTHELRSAGQVTERVLHLCALNCLLAVVWCRRSRWASSPTRRPSAAATSYSAQSCAPETPVARSTRADWLLAKRTTTRNCSSTSSAPMPRRLCDGFDAMNGIVLRQM